MLFICFIFCPFTGPVIFQEMSKKEVNIRTIMFMIVYEASDINKVLINQQ